MRGEYISIFHSAGYIALITIIVILLGASIMAVIYGALTIEDTWTTTNIGLVVGGSIGVIIFISIIAVSYDNSQQIKRYMRSNESNSI